MYKTYASKEDHSNIIHYFKILLNSESSI